MYAVCPGVSCHLMGSSVDDDSHLNGLNNQQVQLSLAWRAQQAAQMIRTQVHVVGIFYSTEATQGLPKRIKIECTGLPSIIK